MGSPWTVVRAGTSTPIQLIREILATSDAGARTAGDEWSSYRPHMLALSRDVATAPLHRSSDGQVMIQLIIFVAIGIGAGIAVATVMGETSKTVGACLGAALGVAAVYWQANHK